MAYSQTILNISVPVGSSALKQYAVVYLTSNNNILHLTSASSRRPLGVLVSNPNSTKKIASVCVAGITPVRPTSSAVKAGDLLGYGTSGGLVKTIITSTHVTYGIGVALAAQAAGARTNEVIPMLITHSGRS